MIGVLPVGGIGKERNYASGEKGFRAIGVDS